MDRTPGESSPRGADLLRRWFSANDSHQRSDQQTSGSSPQGSSPRRLGFWVRWLLLIFLINLSFYGPLFFSFLSAQPTTIDLSYSRFLQQVEQGNVASVTASTRSACHTCRPPASLDKIYSL